MRLGAEARLLPSTTRRAHPALKLCCFVKDGLESACPSGVAIACLLALLLAIGKLLAVVAVYQAGER